MPQILAPRKPLELQQRASPCLLQVVWTSGKGLGDSRDLHCLLCFTRLRLNGCGLVARVAHLWVMQELFQYCRRHNSNQEDVRVWLRLMHGYLRSFIENKGLPQVHGYKPCLHNLGLLATNLLCRPFFLQLLTVSNKRFLNTGPVLTPCTLSMVPASCCTRKY